MKESQEIKKSYRMKLESAGLIFTTDSMGWQIYIANLYVQVCFNQQEMPI